MANSTDAIIPKINDGHVMPLSYAFLQGMMNPASNANPTMRKLETKVINLFLVTCTGG